MEIATQQGRVILVTGANSGIGRAAAQALAAAGAAVIVSGRSETRVAAAVDAIRAATGNPDVQPLAMDLASLASVREAAAEVLDRWERLDVLINNAGVILSERQLSAEGYEMTFTVNHLGHFLLTDLLLDRLKASAPSRIVNVTSTAHRGADDVGFDDLHAEHAYSANAVYSRTKLANILFTKELARRLAGTGVTAFAVHPGTVRTEWSRGGDTHGLMSTAVRLARPFFVSPSAGAASTIYAATAPGIESRSGAYFLRSVLGNYGPVKQAQPSKAAQDPEAAARLWEVSEQLVAAGR